MKVSIIIPSYRQPHFLGRAIQSCLEQDHTDLEVIVVDDRSRDASLGVALSFSHDPRVRVIECDVNGGLGKARNIGISHSTGELLCFLDSDDYLLDRSLSARVEALPAAIDEHGEQVVGVYGDWQHVAESIDYPTVRAARSYMPLVNASTYTGENVFICSAPLVRRDAVIAAGGFPEGLKMLEDFALWAKMIAGGAVFVPVHHVVATYRQRPNSMLRGDGLVVMADHVDVINTWVRDEGTLLADGGAMRAWLADETPFSHGRMTWNVPSILGNYGGAAGADAVTASTGTVAERQERSIEDFMTTSVVTGLENPPPVWVGYAPTAPTMALIARSLQHSIEAVAIIDQFVTESITIGVFADDANDWKSLWPLALAGHAVRSESEIPAETTRVDLGDVNHQFADRDDLIPSAVEKLWPNPSERVGSLVYVPVSLMGYPALDAWLSTALHALAVGGHSPKIVCDPEMRPHLGGYRSDVFSVDMLRSATHVVTPTGSHVRLVEALAPTVVFDPSSRTGDHARTRAQLEDALD